MDKHDDEIRETTFSNVEIPEEKKKSTYDFEMVLEYIGQMGKYQALLAIFLIYSALPVGMDSLSAVFLLGVPQHRCHIPGVDGNPKYMNYSYQYLRNISTPATSEGYDGCKMFDYNYTSCLDEKNPDCSMASGLDPVTVPCQSYVYTSNEFEKTMVNEWDLVCDRLILGTTLSTVYFAGGLIGCILAGNVSDNIGRRYVLLIGTILAVASGMVCAFTTHLAVMTAMRFVLAIASSAIFQVGFVYVTEILGENWRVIVGSLYNSAFAVGYCLLSAMAFYWTNWRRLQLAMTSVFAPFLIMWILLPESPRWLFARGRNSEGKRVSLLIAKRNGLAVPNDIWRKTMQQNMNEGGKQRYYSTASLFRGRGIREVTLIMMFCYFTAAIVYLGISLNVGTLAGGIYLNNALSGIAEIAAGPCAIVLLKRFGRKLPTSLSFILAGVMCTASTLVNHYSSVVSWRMDILGTSLALCGKLAISTAYDIIYMYITELYPTVVRASALSTCMAMSLIAFTVTPYTLHLQHYFAWLPGVIFGALSILSGIASLRLKETRRHKMMTTLDEAEKFYRI